MAPKLPHQTLLLQILSLIALFVMLANKADSQDTTSFTFDSFSSNPTQLTYQGDAHVPSGSTFLRLTKTDSSGNPQRSSVGRVLYSSPIQFWESSLARQASFETTIRFLITRSGNRDPADGIAFFIAPVNSAIPSGSGGANLGIFGSSGTSSSVFAVEFDIYVNSAWDPNYRHIGIDINSRNSRNVTRFDNAIGQVVTARINYEAVTRVISVVANAGSQTYTVSYVFDLKSILPHQVQVGISASTGAEVAIHDIQSWYFTSTLVRERNSVEDNSKNKSDNEETYI